MRYYVKAATVRAEDGGLDLLVCECVRAEVAVRIAAAMNEVESEPIKYKPIEDAPRDGTPILVPLDVSYRWLPYKDKSQQAKQGIYGRWQWHNGYGWENAAMTGTVWRATPPIQVFE